MPCCCVFTILSFQVTGPIDGPRCYGPSLLSTYAAGDADGSVWTPAWSPPRLLADALLFYNEFCDVDAISL